MKTAIINTRISPEVKEQAKKLLQAFGMNHSQFVNMCYNTFIRTKKLPELSERDFNNETIQSFKDYEEKKNLSSYSSVDELFNDLDN